MKITLLGLALFFTLCSPGKADILLEHTLSSGSSEAKNIRIAIRGKQVRADLSNKLTVLLDFANNHNTLLLHEPKTAIATTANLTDTVLKSTQWTQGKPERTEETERIQDLDCEIWRMQRETGSTRMWIAPEHPDYPAFLTALEELAVDHSLLGLPQLDLGGMLVRSETEKEGTLITTQLKRFSSAELPEDLFQIPANYQSVRVGSKK